MAEEPAVDFGTFLRQAREKRGISLQQVSATTKISARVLDALERNDPRKLPGGIFSRAFVRSYAREVGLDPERVIEQFIAAFPDQAGAEATPTTAVPDDPETFESRRRAATTVAQLVGVCVVIIVIVLIYYSMHRNDPPPVRVVPDTTQERQPAPQPAGLAPSGSAPGLSSSDIQSAPGAQSAQPAAVETQAAATTAPAPSAGPPSPVAPNAPLTVGITTNAACWLSLTVDGTRVVGRTLEPGEHVSYPVRTTVTIIAGNAGALSLTLNGKAARPVGTSGQVVTTTITPDTFKNFLQQP
jgi:cytoskeleton protein RodZ